jgi:hypothetical protein
MVLISVAPILYKRYKDKLEKEDKIEKFDSSEDAVYIISSLFNLLLTGIALFLCFQRNGSNVNVGAVIVAFCCPFCYLVYALAVPVT